MGAAFSSDGKFVALVGDDEVCIYAFNEFGRN